MMVALIFFFLNLVASPFKSKSRLEAENAALRHQLTVPRRKIRGRVQFTNGDRLFFIQLYRWCPSVLKAMMIIPRIMFVPRSNVAVRRCGVSSAKSCGGNVARKRLERPRSSGRGGLPYGIRRRSCVTTATRVHRGCLPR